jgi:hypothetical protein
MPVLFQCHGIQFLIIANIIKQELSRLRKSRIARVAEIFAIKKRIRGIAISVLNTLGKGTGTNIFFGKRIARIPYPDTFVFSIIKFKKKSHLNSKSDQFNLAIFKSVKLGIA